MVRPKVIHEEVSKIHCFERDRYLEFEQLCKNEKISVSEGLRILIERELEKKAEGEERTNPLNLPNSKYTYVLNPKKDLQSDIRQFMRRNDIIKTAKNLKADECEIIANNLLRVSRFKR